MKRIPPWARDALIAALTAALPYVLRRFGVKLACAGAGFAAGAALFGAVPAIAAPERAKPRHDAIPLARGDYGPRVLVLQRIVNGKRPSVFRVDRFQGRPNGLYGKRTARAVLAVKWRLGFPMRRMQPIAGNHFLAILTGKKKRPVSYVVRAAKRIRASRPVDNRAGACVRRLLAVARSQVGVVEVPDGSNWGPQVQIYQSVTGAYRLAWCVSFTQWAAKRASGSTFAGATAGVRAVKEWGHAHGHLRAYARPGFLVLFMDRYGNDARNHIGIVERVFRGGFVSIEGNTSNAVRRRVHYLGSRPVVFLRLPNCSPPR